MHSTLWIKICGLTTPEGVAAAVAARVNAIGFVFAASKRRVSAQQACDLAQQIPVGIQRFAVMQHPVQAALDEVWNLFRPDVLQTDADDLARLQVPRGLAIMPVLRAGCVLPDTLPQQLLFEGPVSGSGETADWSAATQLARRTQLILAGGLRVDNVATAIACVRPFGIDVSSGVESAPGIKDAGLIAMFVNAARCASRLSAAAVPGVN